MWSTNITITINQKVPYVKNLNYHVYLYVFVAVLRCDKLNSYGSCV